MPPGGYESISGINDPHNGRLGQEPFRAWTEGLGQRPAQCRAGGVDGAVGVHDVQGGATFGLRKWRQERIGLGPVEVEQC